MSGMSTFSPLTIWVPGLVNGTLGWPSRARSMIDFQTGAAIVIPNRAAYRPAEQPFVSVIWRMHRSVTRRALFLSSGVPTHTAVVSCGV
ncbi:MAG: hypothetical protein BWY91_01781 [bacterium ADurb.BinA028]|nr:MAG: hypothetical protein BWY91_01781 [bacterium ADurb.BinA028]